ncbi:GerW family sporulation protein [Synechococcus sp. PCC 7336]|uniref:GerW family sporulation protein n=1 Tax=Synechococcus sp. PCC 7336 TaxID=195250 RepID=UPI00034A4F84|nr:spore germination protein GerW family protein [Synechococcus sp. PCC 7336]
MSEPNAFPVDNVLDAVLSKLRSLAETGQTFGEPIAVGETTIVPYVSLRFGLGGGGGGAGDRHNGGHGSSGLWGGAGGGVKVEPMGFLVIRADKVELLPIDRESNQWAQLAEGLMPMLEQWLQQRAEASSEAASISEAAAELD